LDKIHGQEGVARNGAEIHPVLRVKRRAGVAVDVPGTAPSYGAPWPSWLESGPPRPFPEGYTD